MPRAGMRTRSSATGKETPAPTTTSRRVSGRKRKSEAVEEEGIQLSETERLKQKAKYE